MDLIDTVIANSHFESLSWISAISILLILLSEYTHKIQIFSVLLELRIIFSLFSFINISNEYNDNHTISNYLIF